LISKHKNLTLARLLSLAVIGFVNGSGCATSPTPEQTANRQGQVVAQPSDPQQADERLAQLVAERNRDAFADKFSIGPGDLIEVSVPDVPELKDQTVRVTMDGTISLPMAGTVNATGLTEEELRADLRQRIAKYVKDPDVKLLVKQYYSRQVAVTGMVQKPGVYTLQSRTDTLLEVLGRAGGLAENASRQILFIPSATGGLKRESLAELVPDGGRRPASTLTADDDATPDQRLASEKPDRITPVKLETHPTDIAQAPAFSTLDRDNPITINLTDAVLSEIPIRPGDVIIVPAVGEVMVQGWVMNPGAFKITTGMTALGAIGAAGGPMFSSSAEVLRLGPEGRKVKMPIDLSKIQAGDEADVPVQSGDVVVVNRSLAGGVPYAIYTLFNKFGTGTYFVP
jgi:protein involved in polysaccharide export with SLBB domain